MFFSHLFPSSRFKTFITLFFIFSLSACSVSQPEALLTDDGLISSSSVTSGDVIADGPIDGDSYVSDDNAVSDGNSTRSSNDDNTASGGNSTSSPNDDNTVSGGNSTSSSPKKAFKVAWNAPLQREDGSNLALSEIAEYRVYYGSKKGNYKNVIVVDGNSTLEAENSSVPSGKYYVAVTTVDSDGRESAYSKEIIVTI